MKTEDAWYFNIYNLKEGDYIGCPICKKYNHHNAWQETTTGYENCPVPILAIVCPSCGRVYDYLNDAALNFKVQKTTD